MIGLFWLYMIFVPFLMGTLTLYVTKKKGTSFVLSVSESYLLGGALLLGIGQVVHLGGLFFQWNLSRCTYLFLMASSLCALAGGILVFVKWLKKENLFAIRKIRGASFWYPLGFLLVLLGLLLYVYLAPAKVIKGDIMLETVQSFVAEEGIYLVNPLTGQAYEYGMPLRYQILSLPTLYSMFALLFELPVGLMVSHLIPVLVLMASFLSFYRLSQSLFGEEYNKRYSFLIIVALLFWFGAGNHSMEGFRAIYGAHQATSIRNLVILPMVLAMGMEKKWSWCALLLIAEACITWTFMGMGVSVVITLAMVLFSLLEKWNAAGSGWIKRIYRK